MGFPEACGDTKVSVSPSPAFARHDRLARRRVAKVVEAQPAEPDVGADRAPAPHQYPLAPALGMAREQEGVRVACAGQRLDPRPRGPAERHGARAVLRVFEIERVCADIAPAQIEHFAAAATGERQQPDRGDGLGPFGVAGVERAPEPGQLVRVEESGDALRRVPLDAETGVAVAGPQAPFLRPEHNRAQYLERAVGQGPERARPKPIRYGPGAPSRSGVAARTASSVSPGKPARTTPE